MRVLADQVKVKTLRLITQLREKGGINFRQELSASATDTVKELVNFTAEPDPVHGDKPAQLVRTFAEKARQILEMPAETNLVAQTQEGVGSRFSKTFGTLGKNITTAAAAAASAAAEAAHEAGEIATAKAEQARHEMERRQLEQQRAGRNMFSAAIAGGGSVADIVAKVNTTLAQERDAAVANVAKLTAEVNSLQGGAMMQMHSEVLRENEALKEKVAALEAQVASLTQANQTAQAAVAAANAGGPVPAAAPVQEAVPPTADVDALLSGFGAPAAAPAPAAAAPAPAPATSAPAPATDADAAAPAPAPGPTRAELAAQVGDCLPTQHQSPSSRCDSTIRAWNRRLGSVPGLKQKSAPPQRKRRRRRKRLLPPQTIRRNCTFRRRALRGACIVRSAVATIRQSVIRSSAMVRWAGQRWCSVDMVCPVGSRLWVRRRWHGSTTNVIPD
eukprot:COSAG02_NODE_3172_length_7230_cov_8.725004_3_plen_446_part_00